jgi:cell division septation protein DedD
LSQHIEDDGFHEIQLNGKQLVFAFMAVTVVTVVIFLCGVLVGRGVKSERAAVQGADAPAEFKELGLDPARAVIPPTVQPGSDPTLAAPPAPPEGEQVKANAGADKPTAASSAGSAKDAKTKVDAKTDDKKPAPDAGRSAAIDSKTPAAVGTAPRTPTPHETAAAAAPAIKDAPSAAEPAQEDWVVQVAAVKKRGEADTIARRLGSKGYSTFVLAEGQSVFRVRVGGYKTKREADVVAAKLRKEERINPWVTQRHAP